jgi:flavorubredoxin
MPQVLTEPSHYQAPTELAADTFVVHEVQHALGQPVSVYLNSMVIKAREPVLIDTGSARNRRAWLEDTFALVEPADVRWVFVSHEDPDHVGNLNEVMELCPKATLICSWALTERFHSGFEFSLERCRWADDGATIDAGDRTLSVIRPPVYDSPTTRGLLDTSTGIYWAVDMFATSVPGGVGADRIATQVSELDDEAWQHGLVMFGLNALSPWLEMVDAQRFSAEVARVQGQGIPTIVSGHSPAISGDKVPEAWDRLRSLAGMEAPPTPDQAVLDLIIAATQMA